MEHQTPQSHASPQACYVHRQFVSCRRNEDYLNEDEVCANNVFAVCSPKAYNEWVDRGYVQEHQTRFRIKARPHFGNQQNRYNPDTAIIKILYLIRKIRPAEYNTIAVFPEPEADVAAAPRVPVRKMTTTWANIKRGIK